MSSSPSASSESTVRGERVEGDLRREGRERELGEREACIRRGGDLLVPRLGHDADEQAPEPEVLDARAGERHVADVWRVEGSAQHAGGHGCHSSSSSPISTSAPLRTPASRKAASSSSSGGGSPETR